MKILNSIPTPTQIVEYAIKYGIISPFAKEGYIKSIENRSIKERLRIYNAFKEMVTGRCR